MKKRDIDELDQEAKSLRIVDTLLKDKNINIKEIVEATPNEILDAINICSFAMSFDRQFVSNQLMATMITLQNRGQLYRFRRRLFKQFIFKKSSSLNQKKYFLNILLNKKDKLSYKKAFINEICTFLQFFKNKKDVEPIYKNNGVDMQQLIYTVRRTNGDVEKMISWITKKTSSQNVIIHFEKIINKSFENISKIEKAVNSIDKKFKNKRDNLDFIEINNSKLNPLSILKRFSNNNPIVEAILDSKLSDEKRKKIVVSFALANLYNKKFTEINFLISLIIFDRSRQLEQFIRETIRRYKTAKRYSGNDKYYFENCLISGWGENKKELAVATIIKGKLYRFRKSNKLEKMFTDAGIELNTLIKRDNLIEWRKIYTRKIMSVSDERIKKILKKLIVNSEFTISLIDNDLYSIRNNKRRLYIPWNRK